MVDDASLQQNRNAFRECLSGTILRKMAAKPEKKVKKRAAKKRHNTIEYVEEEHGGRAEDLADFTEVGGM